MSFKHRVLIAFSAGALLVGAAACGGSSSSSSSSKKTPAAAAGGSGTAITIKNFMFSPTPLKAKVDDTIKVTDTDSTQHTATADDGSFDTKPIKASGGTATIKVTKAGTIPYHCDIHNFMHGSIQVGT